VLLSSDTYIKSITYITPALLPFLTYLLTLPLGMRVVEDRVLKRIFGPTRDEAKLDLRKLHNEGHHNCTFRTTILK
jgi:hypothetical protein